MITADVHQGILHASDIQKVKTLGNMAVLDVSRRKRGGKYRGWQEKGAFGFLTDIFSPDVLVIETENREFLADLEKLSKRKYRKF